MRTQLFFVIAFLLISLLPGSDTIAQDANSMALSPARFELEMKPGTETTVVLNLDYRSADDLTKPARILASLSDWTISRDGRVQYFPAGSTPNSASSWLVYSPGEASVTPGTVHQIRVTISVPINAPPGDHLTAVIVEQRPNTLKGTENSRQMIVRYRMASVFYIKVPGLTRKGNFENLYAEATDGEITLTPVLRNEGNSVIRPTASVTVEDENGRTVVGLPEVVPIPILGGAETAQPLKIEQQLAPGSYSVKYQVDFNDGSPATKGVTELVVKPRPQIAANPKPARNP